MALTCQYRGLHSIHVVTLSVQAEIKHFIPQTTSRFWAATVDAGTVVGISRCHKCIDFPVLVFSLAIYSVRQKKVSPKVSCHFLSNHLEFLREILRVYYLFMYT